MTRKRSGRWFYVAGGLLIFWGIIGRFIPHAEEKPGPPYSDSTPAPAPKIPQAVEVRRAIPANTPDTGFPAEITLTHRVLFHLRERGASVGLMAFPAGTVVKLIEVRGTDVLIEKDGLKETIPIDSTDMVHQIFRTPSE